MIPANFVGLRFLLQHGAFLQIQVPKQEAEQIVGGFIQDKLPPVIGSTEVRGLWSLRIHDVVAIHAVPLEDLRSQQAPPTGPVWRPGMSGI